MWPSRWFTPTRGRRARVGEGLGRRAADQERAHEAGPVGHRDAVEVGEPDRRRVSSARRTTGTAPRGAGARPARAPRRRRGRGRRPGRPRRSRASCGRRRRTAAAVSSQEVSMPRTIMSARLSRELGDRHQPESPRFPAGHVFLQEPHRQRMAVGDHDHLAAPLRPARHLVPAGPIARLARARGPPGSAAGPRARPRPAPRRRPPTGSTCSASTRKRRRAASTSSTARIRGRSSVSREPMRFITPTARGHRLQVAAHELAWISPGAIDISSAPGPGSTSGNRYGSMGSPSSTSIPARAASRAIRADSGRRGQHRHRERAPDLAEEVEDVTAAAEVVHDDGHPGRARGQRRRLRERARRAPWGRPVPRAFGRRRPKRSEPNRLASPPRACH